MSIQPTFTPFRQIPQWSEDEIFQITGKQLEAIQNMFAAYTPFVQAIEPVFLAALDTGKITIRYEDIATGEPLTKEYVDEMLQEHARLTAESLNTQ